MSCIHSLYHIDCLASADLSDNDPVRPHTQCGPDEVPDTDRAAPFYICVPRLQAHEIIDMTDLKFGIILNRDHPFISRYIFG